MFYSVATKKKLDTIFKAFSDYIRGQDYFDVVYSEKVGYVRILAQSPEDEAPELLNTPETMLDVLFNEIVNDVVLSPDNTTRDPDARTLSEYEKTESRRRIAAILGTMDEGRDFCLDRLEKYLAAYPNEIGGE